MLWLVICTCTSLGSDQQLQNSQHLFVDSVTKVIILILNIYTLYITQGSNDGHSKV